MAESEALALSQYQIHSDKQLLLMNKNDRFCLLTFQTRQSYRPAHHTCHQQHSSQSEVYNINNLQCSLGGFYPTNLESKLG